MKLLFGFIGVALAAAFLSSFAFKVREISMIVVVLIGLAMMAVDAWQARNESDT